MAKEVNLQIPDSLFLSLANKAKVQGVSIETLCLSLLAEESFESEPLVEPIFYSYMANGELRKEMQKVLQSSLPASEVRKRIQGIKVQISRCIR